MMGLLDFLRTRITGGAGEKVEPESKDLSWLESVYVPEKGSCLPAKPWPLAKQKVYDEGKGVTFGFDFSALRRVDRLNTEWWAEDDNFDKIVEGLRKVAKLEDGARERCCAVPHMAGPLSRLARPYAVGTDRNLVPTIQWRELLGRPSVRAVIEGVDPETGFSVRARITYVPNGEMEDIHLSARASYDAPYWNVTFRSVGVGKAPVLVECTYFGKDVFSPEFRRIVEVGELNQPYKREQKPYKAVNYAFEPDEPEPADKLKNLKAYDEPVDEPCGFDFSAIRRCHGSKGFWWAEGKNFEKVIDALDYLQPFEDEIRSGYSTFPKIIDHLRHELVPYSVGANGNFVPTITSSDDGVTVYVRVCKSTKSPLSRATLKFSPDGSVWSASFVHMPTKGGTRWDYEVKTYKKGVTFRLKDARKDRRSVLR